MCCNTVTSCHGCLCCHSMFQGGKTLVKPDDQLQLSEAVRCLSYLSSSSISKTQVFFYCLSNILSSYTVLILELTFHIFTGLTFWQLVLDLCGQNMKSGNICWTPCYWLNIDVLLYASPFINAQMHIWLLTVIDCYMSHIIWGKLHFEQL